jgi:hypothetical protein
MWLSQFSLATQPGGVPPARVALLQALLDVHLHGPDLTTMVAGDREDVRRWVAILEAVAGAHQLARQGSFRSAIRAAAKLANALPPAHRELAALFLLHVAAEGATFPVEFQDAVAAAEWLDPPTIAPDTIVDGVIRTCLAYPHSPPRPTAISFGLPVTLDVLAGATYPGLSRHDMWALQSVLSELPDAGEQLLRAAPRLHPQDRRQVRKLVEPRAVRRRVRLRWR